MTLPNILSFFRILLVPLFVFAFFSEIPMGRWIALGIFLLAGITDVVDGYIARQYNLITKLGSALDPLADKLMLIAVLACFYVVGYIPLVVLLIVIIKELMMIVTSMYIYFQNDEIIVTANKYGKSATVMFYLAIVTITFSHNDYLNYTVITIAVIMTIIALISYFINMKHREIL